MFLSGNTNIAPASSTAVIINRDDLAAIARNIGDGYYGDKGYWKKVAVTYEKGSGPVSQTSDLYNNFNVHRQQVVLKYESNNSYPLAISANAMKGAWEIRDVTIFDRDHGELNIPRTQIPNYESYDFVVQ